MFKFTRTHMITMMSLMLVIIGVSIVLNPFEKMSKPLLYAEDHPLRIMEAEETTRTIPVFLQAGSTELVQNDDELDSKIKEIIEPLLQEGALVGISVRSKDNGELLYDHMGHLNLHPASNMKLLTGMTAFEVLGPDYQFQTELWTDGVINDGTLSGNIYLKGKGDPSLLQEDFEQFAQALKSQGIYKIKGHLIGDDSWYDDVRYSQDLNWSDEMNYTGAAISALTLAPKTGYDAGAIILNIEGTQVGSKPHVTIIPDNQTVQITNDAKTVAKDQVEGITVERLHGTNHFIVKGSIGVGGSQEIWRSVWEPTLFTLHILKKALEQQGVTLEGDIVRGVVPDNAQRIHQQVSPPLSELMIPFMKMSLNSYGEIFVKEMGKVVYGEGSWDQGIQVVLDELEKLGIDPETILIRDGSGMSHKNLIQPHTLTELLYKVQEKSWFDAFKQAQPIAGDQTRLGGGSLMHRMQEAPLQGNVFAKTGSLTGVNTLSGYATSVHGREFIFSVMVNNYIDGYMPRVVDAIVKVLVEEL